MTPSRKGRKWTAPTLRLVGDWEPEQLERRTNPMFPPAVGDSHTLCLHDLSGVYLAMEDAARIVAQFVGRPWDVLPGGRECLMLGHDEGLRVHRPLLAAGWRVHLQ